MPAPADGYVTALGAIAIGNAAVHLGAGRRTKEDAIDHSVGVVCLAKRGDAVVSGEPLAEVHARDDEAASEAITEVLAAYATAPSRRLPATCCSRWSSSAEAGALLDAPEDHDHPAAADYLSLTFTDAEASAIVERLRPQS